jgi:hypothetical protein
MSLNKNITDWNHFESEDDFNKSFNDVMEMSDKSGKPPSDLNIPYTVMEAFVAIAAVIGNALVIIVFIREQKLRKRTNYYIVSLALADFLVGLLGIPFAILVRKKLEGELLSYLSL